MVAAWAMARATLSFSSIAPWAMASPPFRVVDIRGVRCAASEVPSIPQPEPGATRSSSSCIVLAAALCRAPALRSSLSLFLLPNLLRNSTMRTMFNWILPVNSRFDQSWHTWSVVVELWKERGEGLGGDRGGMGQPRSGCPRKKGRRVEGYWHEITTNRD